MTVFSVIVVGPILASFLLLFAHTFRLCPIKSDHPILPCARTVVGCTPVLAPLIGWHLPDWL